LTHTFFHVLSNHQLIDIKMEIEMTDLSFSRLWGWQGQRASRDFTPFVSDEAARAMRDQAYLL